MNKKNGYYFYIIKQKEINGLKFQKILKEEQITQLKTTGTLELKIDFQFFNKE